MESNFSEISLTSDRVHASRACDILENHGISVMIEHVDLRSGNTLLAGYRVLVPESVSEQAVSFLAQSHLLEGEKSR